MWLLTNSQGGEKMICAIVNSCFSVTLDDGGAVEHSHLVYGGMEKTTIVAHKTQQIIAGK